MVTSYRARSSFLPISTVVAVVAVATLITAMVRPAQGTEPRDRFLLLDSRIVAEVDNAELTLGMVEKHPNNPLFTEDKPWEKRFDNLYGNVIYDEEEELYKCWYSPFTTDTSARGMTLEQRQKKYQPPHGRTMSLCYATSLDGLQWEKPNLDIVDYEGSTANNIVWTGPHGAGVYKDLRESDFSRRYKLVMQGVKTSTSADGIHWSDAERQAEIGGQGDTHNNVFWAPTLNRYTLITRSWMDMPGSDGVRKRARVVSRSESPDFDTWTALDRVIEPQVYEKQPYAMSTFYYGGVYLGIIAVHQQAPVDRVWPELAWSPDTKKWHRVAEGTPLIPLAKKPLAYDYGCIYACVNPIILEDEIRIYYGASDYLHFGWRVGSLALATLRPDGFAGYEQKSAERAAVVTTTAISFTNQSIRLNADVSEGGSINVTVLDEDGQVLTTAESVRETVTDGRLKMNEQIRSDSICLRFELLNAKLYSFSLAE